MSTSIDTARKIRLRVSNQKAYVWDVDDIAALRAQHHVCGVLAGTLPHLSQQNVFLGIPLVLLPEEVVLLVHNQLAVLVDDPRAHLTPNTDQLREWNAERTESVNLQIAAAEAKEASEKAAKKHTLSEEALRKRKEREERRAAAERAKAIAEGEQVDDDSVVDISAPNLVSTSAKASGSGSSAAPQTPQERPGTPSTPGPSSTSTTTPAHTITLSASSTSLSWYDPACAEYTTIEDARSVGIWTYPATLHERAKCGVFLDLWEKGYFMGGGIKFGGDFLVYPGDPLRYHSHFVATVIDAPLATIQPMEIVAHGRLGTATKKAHLLCGWDDEKQTVDYFSIEWAGFG